MVSGGVKCRTGFYGQVLLVKARPQGVRNPKSGIGTERYDSLMLARKVRHAAGYPVLDSFDEGAGLRKDFLLSYIMARTETGLGGGRGYASVGLWEFGRGISWAVKSGS